LAVFREQAMAALAPQFLEMAESKTLVEQAMAALAPQFLEMAESKTLVEQAMAALAPQFQEVQKLVDQLDWDAVLASP
jgi:hypothetical protein